ncbi:MAG: hypothetical protein M3O50_08190, partial [Myxococcota bacterium]|nr:hypothetical protein [Myxococcota bacterium]
GGSSGSSSGDAGGSSGSGTGSEGGAVTGSTAMGNPDGTGSFTNVATALFIPATTSPNAINVYLFSKPVTCLDISNPAWFAPTSAHHIASGTQYLELALSAGTSTTPITPGTYTLGVAGMSVTPAYSVAPSATDTLGVSVSTATVASYTAMTSISGSFDLHFTGGGTLTGTFATSLYCPNGVEP